MPDDSSRYTEPIPGGRTKRYDRAMAFIESNLGRPIGLDDIAGAACMSRDHFTRGFKAVTGMTPVRYLWSRRIRMAKAMLLGTDASIIDVAFMSGFSSQSHLTTMFKRATGRTPAVWRRQERMNPAVPRCHIDGCICPKI